MYKRYEGNGILEWATMIRLVYRFCRGMFFSCEGRSGQV